MKKRIALFLILALCAALLAGCSVLAGSGEQSSEWTLNGETFTVAVPQVVSYTLTEGKLTVSFNEPVELDFSGLEKAGGDLCLEIAGPASATKITFPEAQVCTELFLRCDAEQVDLTRFTHGEGIVLGSHAKKTELSGAKLSYADLLGDSLDAKALCAASSVRKVYAYGVTAREELSQFAAIPGLEEILLSNHGSAEPAALSALADAKLTALRLQEVVCDAEEIAAISTLTFLQADASVENFAALEKLPALESLIYDPGTASGVYEPFNSVDDPERFAAWEPSFGRAPIDALTQKGVSIFVYPSGR